LIAFLISKTALIPIFGNAGLWQSFLIFYLGRTIFLLIFLPFLYRKLGFKRSGKIF
jgi:MATE family multidrug resistance protein